MSAGTIKNPRVIWRGRVCPTSIDYGNFVTEAELKDGRVVAAEVEGNRGFQHPRYKLFYEYVSHHTAMGEPVWTNQEDSFPEFLSACADRLLKDQQDKGDKP